MLWRYPGVRASNSDVPSTRHSAGTVGSPSVTPNPTTFMLFCARCSCLAPSPCRDLLPSLWCSQAAVELGCSRETSRALNNLPQNVCVFVLDRFWELVHSGLQKQRGGPGRRGGRGRGEGGKRGAALSLFAARENATLHHAGIKKESFPRRWDFSSYVSVTGWGKVTRTLTLVWVQRRNIVLVSPMVRMAGLGMFEVHPWPVGFSISS